MLNFLKQNVFEKRSCKVIMDKTPVQLVIQACEAILSDYSKANINQGYGICGNITRVIDTPVDCDTVEQVLHIIKTTFPSWEFYSGDVTFPIPSPNYNLSAKRYYLYLEQFGGFWEGRQLEYRLDLLRHIIKTLKLRHETS